MRFISTRGGAPAASFEEAVSRGYAPDGGLYVPEALPQLSLDVLERWRGLSFPKLAEAVFGLFVGEEVEPKDLAEIVSACYSGFACDEVVPVRQVGDLFVAELFHGPTFCFKDLGQQPLVRLLAHFAQRRGRRHTMLVSTTGDTGPAAMRAVSDAGSPGLDIVVFFPEGQISELQRRQMTTVSGPGARVATFEGGGDDMDAPLRRLAADRAFAERHGLCGINSYNLGRPVAQTVHYFWSYFRTVDQMGLRIGDPVDVALPSGALGNLAAGIMAKHMGLPVRRFVAGVNTNDITHRTIAHGEFHRSAHMEQTLSDAINIQVPYNMERIFYYLSGEDASLVASWMGEMERTSRLTLPAEWLAKLQETFASCRVDDSAMCSTVRNVFEAHGYLCDPHTAVGVAAAVDAGSRQKDGQGGSVPMVVLATASPCKFQASLTAAVGRDRWEAYAASAAFPAAATAVLRAPERPYARLASCGALEVTHVSWEQEVRRWLEAAAAPQKPNARL